MIIDLWPILAAGITNVIIGMIWYNPRVFGAAWMRMSGISPEALERGKKRMPLMVALGLLSSLVIAYVMSYFALAWGVFDWVGAVELGFWCWAGFVAPVSLSIVLWETKPFTLYLINAGYWLVSFIAMALVLLF
ncbi:MAG: DUF1761 domain-containing protein [Minisyncoccota bacterium]|jgi:hypothetical protein